MGDREEGRERERWRHAGEENGDSTEETGRTSEQQEQARSEWKEADAELKARMEEDEKVDEQAAWYGSKKLMTMLTKDWRLKTQDLHDAVVALSAAAPSSPSLLAYANLLIELCSNIEVTAPRTKSQITVRQLEKVQKCLQKGKHFGSTKPSNGVTKRVLMTGRVATIVRFMLLELRRTPEADAVDEVRRKEDFDDDDKAWSLQNPKLLSLKRREHGEMPLEATATAKLIRLWRSGRVLFVFL